MTSQAGQPIRVAVLVSGGGSNLQALLDAQVSGKLKSGRISLVISDQHAAYALTRAKEAGVKQFPLDRKLLGHRLFEQELMRTLQDHRIELIVLAGFLTILSADFVQAYEGRIINVHPSLIPAFCGEGFYGIRVHRAALKRGVKITGATVHYVNEEPDGGPIILQKAVRVGRADTAEKLQLRVMREAEWVILPRAVEQVCRKLLKERSHHATTQS